MGAQAELPVAVRQASELDELKGFFLANLNHEIRTPLSGILGMTDLLLETPLDTEQRDYVTSARLCAENLFEVLNATLEYSALAAGRIVIEESEFSLAETLEAAVEPHRERARAKNLRLMLTVDPALPETLAGDAARLKQVIGHLAANAVKFTPTGEVEVRALSTDEDRLMVEVRDTGIGIETDKLARIFDSFHQADVGLARSYAGLGLGLALAQGLVRLMGGQIDVESRPGAGTRFSVELPLRRPLEMAGTGAGVERPCILVVDDDKIGQTVYRHFLRRGNYEVHVAGSSREAIESAAAHHFDLILMDVHLPDVDGLETSRRIREMNGYRRTPILALTANSTDSVRAACRQAGMQAYLTKPVPADELRSAVAKYLILPVRS